MPAPRPLVQGGTTHLQLSHQAAAPGKISTSEKISFLRPSLSQCDDQDDEGFVGCAPSFLGFLNPTECEVSPPPPAHANMMYPENHWDTGWSNHGRREHQKRFSAATNPCIALYELLAHHRAVLEVMRRHDDEIANRSSVDIR
jgi:hypothetical protein